MKLLVSEPGSEHARPTFETAEVIAISQLGYVEVHSALARMKKGRRLSARAAAGSVAELERLWPDLAVIPADHDVVLAAAGLARAHGLRAYDAMHLATALTLVDTTPPDFVCFDVELRDAAAAEGLAVLPS